MAIADSATRNAVAPVPLGSPMTASEMTASLMAAGVPVRLAGALTVALGLWLAVAWALDWF